MERPELRSRRQFLKEGAAGIAGTAILSACSDAPSLGALRPRQGRSAIRTLGRTGLKLPVVSMGSCYAVNLVQSALDEGIVYIHTSSDYGEENQERLLGEAFRGRPRDGFVIATSPALPYRFRRIRGRSEDLGFRIDPRLIERSIEESLRRLRVDAVDIYYLCSVGSREVQFEPYVEAYERVKKAGKARFVGVGTHDNEPEAIRAAAEGGFWDVILTAYNFRQSHRDEIRDAIGHGQPMKAREALGRQPAGLACANCARCEVACALGLDVRSRTLGLAQLLDLRA